MIWLSYEFQGSLLITLVKKIVFRRIQKVGEELRVKNSSF
jgi:hypothetical protein